ncbi:MAG: SIMPL domain-containing protein [Dehalococcoidia bacterium]
MRLNSAILVGVFLLTIGLASAGCAPAPAVVYQGSPAAVSSGGIIISQQSLGLWVNGEGKTTGVPDVVVLQLGVQSQDQTVAPALKAAANAMDNIMQVLKSGGVADKDLTTSQFSIQQLTRWDDKTSTNIVIGYQVSNMVTAKIRDITKAGAIIDAAAEAGGDLIRVNSINFMVDDPTPLLKVARDKAIQDAMDRAQQMAQTSGVKLGKLLYITESSPIIPYTQTNYMKLAVPSAAGAAPTSISPGELEFQSNVQLVYEID